MVIHKFNAIDKLKRLTAGQDRKPRFRLLFKQDCCGCAYTACDRGTIFCSYSSKVGSFTWAFLA